MQKQFTPGKKYQYQLTDKIVFSGAEFKVFDEAFNKLIVGNSVIPSLDTLMALRDVAYIIQNKTRECVENGIFTEHIEELAKENGTQG